MLGCGFCPSFLTVAEPFQSRMFGIVQSPYAERIKKNEESITLCNVMRLWGLLSVMWNFPDWTIFTVFIKKSECAFAAAKGTKRKEVAKESLGSASQSKSAPKTKSAYKEADNTLDEKPRKRQKKEDGTVSITS